MSNKHHDSREAKTPLFDDQVAIVFAELGQQLHRHFQDVVSAMDLTPIQAIVLRMTSDPTRMGVLAAKAQCQPSHITGVVDDLEGRGWLVRGPDPADRRAQLIQQTEAGAEIERAIIDRLASSAMHPLNNLTNDEKHQLLALLTKAVGPAAETTGFSQERD